MIIAITNLKGGVGKTTTAVALACAAQAAGESVRLVDADAQGSATEWAYAADENGEALPFDVEAGNQASISRLKDKEGEWVFIDCPPTGTVADEAVKTADIVVVPMTPSEVDMRQTWATVQTLSAAEKPYAVLIVRADKRTLTFRAVIDALKEESASYFDTAIPQREDVKNSFGYAFADLYGYDEVFREIKEAL